MKPSKEELERRIKANAIVPDIEGGDVVAGVRDLTGLHPMLAYHVARVAILGGTREEIAIVQGIIDDHVADNASTRDTITI